MQLNKKAESFQAYQPMSLDASIHMDANESFIPMPKELAASVNEAVSRINFNRYPDPASQEVCSVFAKLYDVSPEMVVAGNGSDELISIIFNVFLQRWDAYATIEPDFSMYAFNGQLCEARHIPIGKRGDLSIDVQNVIDTCHRENVRMLIFSNPCNPTSLGLAAPDVRKIVEGVNCLVVLDEAYMDFWDESLISEINNYDNLIILKTCSKAFGLAGIRLGFAIAPKRLRDILMSAKAYYNVNAVSQCIGTVVMREKELLSRAFGSILASKIKLEKELKRLSETGNFSVLDSKTNFITLVMNVPEKFWEYMAGQGISIRLTSGLIRVTCSTAEDNREFISCAETYFSNTL